MRRCFPASIALGMFLSLSAGIAVIAHSDSGEENLEVEPISVTAGGTVILAGSGLEADSDRVLVLAGEGLTVEFGTVKTDAEGMFSAELTIPNHLPSGNFELRAIGDETLTTNLAVTMAAGAAGVSSTTNDPTEVVVARQRTPAELAPLGVLVVIAVLLGGWLVWRAERFRGPVDA